MPETHVYTISTAAELVGISVHTIRMYEKEGLILPYKKNSNQRRYSDKDIERIKCIRRTINEHKMTIEGIRRVLALIPCWTIIKCKDSDKTNCEAYNGYTQPCWMINHKNNLCAGKICRECEVYNSFSNCSSIKNKLKEILK